MKRLLLGLLPWMATMAAAGEDTPRPASVSYTHVGTQRIGVFRLGEECLVDHTMVGPWGWSVSVRRDVAEVRAEGKTIRVGMRNVNGQKLLPMNPVLSSLGAGFKWKPEGDLLEVWGVATNVEAIDGRILVESTLSGKPKVFQLKSPGRVVLDMQGVRMDSRTKVATGPGARARQYTPGALRVVMEVDAVLSAYRISPTRRFEYAPRITAAVPTTPVGTSGDENDPVELPVDAEPAQPPAVKAPQAPAKPLTVRVSMPEMVAEKGEDADLRIGGTSSLPGGSNFRRVDPETITVWLPGTMFDGDRTMKLRSRSVTTWDVSQEPNGALYTFKLRRPMGVELSTFGREARLRLIAPEGDSRLSGKTIVVDAGHGGHDTGAKSPGKDVYEKNLTLAIAKQLSQRLASQGATVIMTRKTDVFIPLKERSMIANRASADLFVSVHINSSRTPNRTSGGITFFHKRDAMGQLLADCIQGQIGKTRDLPSIGTWSDTRIYSSGFAVLRYSKMPSVLIEVGFLNHSFDRGKMVTSSFQERIAGAIVKGIRVYFGDGQAQEEE